MLFFIYDLYFIKMNTAVVFLPPSEEISFAIMAKSTNVAANSHA